MSRSFKIIFGRYFSIINLILLSAFAFKAEAQTWQSLGPDDANQLSPGHVDGVRMATDPNGIPYAVFSDDGNNSKATVRMYNGANWVTVGAPGFSPGLAYQPSIAFNGTTPYVVFGDGANDYRTTVMMYDGSSWVTVGAADFSPAPGYSPSIAFNGSTPYVAYSDGSSNFPQATVVMFDGTNWVTVGSADFTPGEADLTSLAFVGSVPYIAYDDGNNNSKATVMMFDGANWVPAGTPGFSAGATQSLSIAVNGTTPYVVYLDYNNANKVTVMAFDGANWNPVGTPNFSGAQASRASLAFNGTTPYVVYADAANGGKATVAMYNGQGWVTIGSPDFSSGLATSASMAFSGTTPYVVYSDNLAGAAVAKMFNGANWVQVGNSGITGSGASFVSLAFQGSTPYIAYNNTANQQKANVMSYNGSNWVHLGPQDFSTGPVQSPQLAFSGTTPYLAYVDFLNGGKATVVKFNGSSWVNVGAAAFSAGPLQSIALALSGSTPFVAFSDPNNMGKATVMTYNGSSWVTVGLPDFSAGQVSNISLALSGSTPYVAYADVSNGSKLTVMKYDGANWVALGSPAFSGTVGKASLAFFGTTPYVAFGDSGNSGKASVVMYNGASWVTVGATGFSAGAVQSLSLAFAGAIPCVAYPDVANNNKVTVMMLDGMLWAPLGAAGITAGAESSLSLAVNGTMPYIAYTSGGVFEKYFIAAAPLTPAANVTFSATTATTTTATWTNGDGASRAVFMSAGSSGSPAPANNTAYTANAAFGSGSQIGSSGWYCVYNGTDTSVNITGLSAGSTYQLMTVEYNNSGAYAAYLLSPGAGNPASVTTLSSNADLSSLALSAGTLAPVFTGGTTAYIASVSNGTAAITVTPTVADLSATITVNGTTVSSGTASGAINLNIGANTINVAVTAQDGTTTKTYTVTVTRAGNSNDNLSSLKMSKGIFSPAFTAANLSYTDAVGNTITSVTVTPTTSDTGATVKINGTIVPSGTASGAINLNIGANTINVMVTAQDGTTTKTYTVTVTRAGTSNDNLNSLKMSKGIFSPAFTAANLSYADAVGNTITSVMVTPTTSDTGARVKVNGTAVTSGTASGAINLNVGNNTINVAVTASDGTTTKTYTVTVTRAGTSNDNLTSLKMSKGVFSPAFTAANLSYTDAVGNTVTSVMVTPTASDPDATITVNGTTVPSGTASGAINLPVGSTTVTVAVLASDGSTTKTYTVTITRAGNNNDNLSSLKMSKGIFSPAFAAANLSYADAVGNTITAVTVTPATSDTGARVKVNGTAVTSGTASGAINLNVGNNTINVAVTASDGTTTKTYTVTVTRAGTSNDNLSSLKMSKGIFSPVFTAANLSYTDAVGNTITSVTVTPTASDPYATIMVNGTTVPSGTASGAINLPVGSTIVNVIVLASDGKTTKTYTVTVTRAPGGADSYDQGISVTKPFGAGVQNFESLTLDDGIQVHQGVSPNGDGINDFLQIDNISQYPNNKLSIMNRNGQLIYEASGYDNSLKLFDGHSNKNGQMQLPGTYFYQLDYTVSGITKHKTGFVVLKY